MMRQEFEKLTGIFPTEALYKQIEAAYMGFHGDKAEFCKAYAGNKDGIAERLRNAADKDAFKASQLHISEISKRDEEINKLRKELEAEQEWKPYEAENNVPQVRYEALAKDVQIGVAHYMTDAEALEWICDEFDFDPGKVMILHEVDEYEVSRHRRLRRTGRKIDRRPVYCATDYYYIRFDTPHWHYEAWNGQLRPFYD